jgi:predicted MFS family arabinose efflux permease
MVQSSIAEELEAYELATWFTSAYMIAVASSAPLAGRLATIFSPGLMILGSGLSLAVGAIVTSQAGSFAVFTLGRVLTGIGGGGVMTLSLILVLQLTSRRRRGLFVGMVNLGFTVGVSFGAVVFGALLPVLGWRALFWVQAPVGILAGAGVYLSIPSFATPGPAKEKGVLQKLASIDYAGAVLLTAAIVLFLYGLSGSVQALPMVLSAVPLALFVLVEYKGASDPLIPVRVLQSRGVLFSCLAQLGLMAARWTVLYYAPIFVLAVRGLGPTVAGSVLIPTNLGFGVGGVVVGWLHIRRSGAFWLPCVLSILLFGVALFGLSLTSNARSPAWLYVLVIFLNGFCTGAAMNYTLAHVLHLSTPDTHFIATSLLATFRGFAGSFGTAIGGGVFTRSLRAHLTAGFAKLDGTPDLSPRRVALIRRLLGSPDFVFNGWLSPAEREVAVKGYESAFSVMYACGAALVVLVLLLQAGTGWTTPADHEGEDEIREEIEEHDGRMEA